MKKIRSSLLYSLILVFILSSALCASLFTRAGVTSVSLGSEGTVNGIGAELSWTLPSRYMLPGLRPYSGFALTTSVEDREEPSETVRFYAPLYLGLRYSHALFIERLYAGISADAGVFFFRREGPKQYGNFYDYSETDEINTWGPAGSVNLGIFYVLSQRSALFAEAGYGTARFSEDRVEEGFLSGYRFSAGMRITLSGRNRSLLYE